MPMAGPDHHFSSSSSVFFCYLPNEDLVPSSSSPESGAAGWYLYLRMEAFASVFLSPLPTKPSSAVIPGSGGALGDSGCKKPDKGARLPGASQGA